MTIDSIMQITGASRPTIYLWMKNRGFPKPINEPNRPRRWDNHEVWTWWAENNAKVGRGKRWKENDDA